MAAVRGRGNQATELKLMSIFRSNDIHGWRRNYALYGHPDFVFLKARLAVFVDGCFWHGCPQHGSIPATNTGFWARKLQKNTERDRKVTASLRKKAWRVVRIWQHELKEPAKVARKMHRLLQSE